MIDLYQYILDILSFIVVWFFAAILMIISYIIGLKQRRNLIREASLELGSEKAIRAEEQTARDESNALWDLALSRYDRTVELQNATITRQDKRIAELLADIKDRDAAMAALNAELAKWKPHRGAGHKFVRPDGTFTPKRRPVEGLAVAAHVRGGAAK